MLNSLVRFSLYSVRLCADVASAYHCLLVDSQTTLLHLFFWFHDVGGKLERGKVFQQATQAFGDTSAAFGLEVAILKYIVANAVLSVSKTSWNTSATPTTYSTASKLMKNMKTWKKVFQNSIFH